MRQEKMNTILVGQVLLALGIFIIDLMIPLGIAAGIPYIAVILIGLWLPGRSNIIGWAITCSFLTLLKLMISPPADVAAWWVVITNRGLSVAAIVTVAYMTQRYKILIERANNEIKGYSEKLEKSNKELEHFAYVASHDLQEPLRKIQTFSERLLVKEKMVLSPEGADFLSRIGHAAQRMQDLINGLLSYSRLTYREHEHVNVNLGQVISEVLKDMEVSIAEHGARVDFNAMPVIKADPLRMRQLFQNLISNSIRFRRENEPPVIRISRKDRKDGSLVLHYRDNGIGVSAGSEEKIFQVFYREHGRKYSGSGIGLSICRKIMEQHGGTIRVLPSENGVFMEIVFPPEIL